MPCLQASLLKVRLDATSAREQQSNLLLTTDHLPGLFRPPGTRPPLPTKEAAEQPAEVMAAGMSKASAPPPEGATAAAPDAAAAAVPGAAAAVPGLLPGAAAMMPGRGKIGFLVHILILK